jgi:hypothetical protein
MTSRDLYVTEVNARVDDAGLRRSASWLNESVVNLA